MPPIGAETTLKPFCTFPPEVDHLGRYFRRQNPPEVPSTTPRSLVSSILAGTLEAGSVIRSTLLV